MFPPQVNFHEPGSMICGISFEMTQVNFREEESMGECCFYIGAECMRVVHVLAQLDVPLCYVFIYLGGLMFWSNKNEAMLRMAKRLSLL